MKGNFFKKVEALYENNHRLKEFLEQELEELEKLLTVDSFNEEDVEHFLNIQYSLEQIKNNLLKVGSTDSIPTREYPITFGMLYPIKKEKLFFELVTLFQEISLLYNIDIILFPIEGVNLENQTVSGTIISSTKIEKGVSSIPSFVYNVTNHAHPKSIKIMRKIRNLDKVTIINPINRFNQGILFDMLSSLITKEKFLLHYDVFSPKTLLDFIDRYKGCIIIPEKGKIKDSVFWVHSKSGNTNTYLISSTDYSYECTPDKIFATVKEKINLKKYIILQPIDAINWMNTPLEIRVYLQRNKDGEWTVTEMVGKSEFLAKKSQNKHIAENLQWTLGELEIEHPESTIKELTELSLSCCSLLDYYIPNLGTCTLDFILDQERRPYLLFVKGWETRSYLYSSSKLDWKTYLSNAFQYLYYLYNQRETKEDVIYELGTDKENKQ
ncbi:hypothetical protein IM538_05685 [Cytobacillus suaedae]|nr:hypothetical protein IM538_05685 [Cytobacillus suaedae]